MKQKQMGSNSLLFYFPSDQHFLQMFQIKSLPWTAGCFWCETVHKKRVELMSLLFWWWTQRHYRAANSTSSIKNWPSLFLNSVKCLFSLKNIWNITGFSDIRLKFGANCWGWWGGGDFFLTAFYSPLWSLSFGGIRCVIPSSGQTTFNASHIPTSRWCKLLFKKDIMDQSRKWTDFSYYVAAAMMTM